MNEWIVKRGRRGRRRHRMEQWEAGINLYKTHLSSTTMEKVKAHDRYKHICYWVLRLLYFDSLVSTQVGSFDLIPLRYLAWILFCFLTAQSFGSLFCKCSVHIYKGQNPPLRRAATAGRLWHWDVQGGTISWVFTGGVQYRPTKAHNSDDTQRMLGIITFFFCLFKSLKLKFIQCDFFFFLEFIDFYHNVHLCKHCKICKLIKSHTKKS